MAVIAARVKREMRLKPKKVKMNDNTSKPDMVLRVPSNWPPRGGISGASSPGTGLMGNGPQQGGNSIDA